jgi:hypothetical protein
MREKEHTVDDLRPNASARSMEHSIWVYPWDLLDAGVECQVSELSDSGFTTLSVTATYHAGRLLLPHNPKRTVYFLEDGVAYFEPRSTYYDSTSLKPIKATLAADGDPLQQIILAAHAKSLKVNAWTVFLHNSRLGRENPSMTIENAYGERYSYALCPSHPQVRAYAIALATDLADHYDLAALELEAIGFMGYTHLSHHDKAGICFDLLHDFLLSVCFCNNCKAHFEAQGADAEVIRRVFRKELDTYFASEGLVPVNDVEGVEQRLSEILGSTSLKALLVAREQTVSSLIMEIRSAVRKEVRLVMRAASSSFITGGDAGIEWKSLVGIVDRFLFLQFYREMELVKRELARVMDYQASCNVRLHIGLRAYYPDITSEMELRERLELLDKRRVDGVQFYNYGLLPQSNLQWIRKAITGRP